MKIKWFIPLSIGFAVLTSYRLERQWDEQQVGARRAALRQEHFARTLY